MRVALVSLDPVDTDESDNDQELGYVSIGNHLFLSRLVGVLESISKRAGINANLVSMKSNPAKTQDRYSPHHYTMFDYDEAPGMKQYAEQMPLGKQSLLQMKFKNVIITEDLLKKRAQEFLQSMNVGYEREVASYKVGSGLVLYSVFRDGQMVVVWNGRQLIDVNIFTVDQTIEHKDSFEENFMRAISAKSTLTLWEEHPRGMNCVINFSKDIFARPGCVDRFVLCDKLEELGECEVDSEKRWMYRNCPLSCNQCPDVSR